MTQMTVNVITENGIRRPDYEGEYIVIEDLGETMIIKASEPSEADRLEVLEMAMLDIIMGGLL